MAELTLERLWELRRGDLSRHFRRSAEIFGGWYRVKGRGFGNTAQAAGGAIPEASALNRNLSLSSQVVKLQLECLHLCIV
jgi:hypothetical protein